MCVQCSLAGNCDRELNSLLKLAEAAQEAALPKGSVGHVLFCQPCRRGPASGLGSTLLFFVESQIMVNGCHKTDDQKAISADKVTEQNKSNAENESSSRVSESQGIEPKKEKAD